MQWIVKLNGYTPVVKMFAAKSTDTEFVVTAETGKYRSRSECLWPPVEYR